MGLIWSLVIGALAGWIAGLIRKGQGYGILINMLVGIVGSVVGGFLFGLLGLSASGLIGTLIMSVIGAIAFLFLLDLFRNKV